MRRLVNPVIWTNRFMFLYFILLLVVVFFHVVLQSWHHATRFYNKIFVPFWRITSCALECEKNVRFALSLYAGMHPVGGRALDLGPSAASSDQWCWSEHRGNINRTALVNIILCNIVLLYDLPGSLQGHQIGFCHIWTLMLYYRGGLPCCFSLLYGKVVLVKLKPDLDSRRPTGFIQCFDAIGWVIWPVKNRHHMIYKLRPNVVWPRINTDINGPALMSCLRSEA